MTQSVNTPEQNPFAVDPESDLPVGLQLTWRLRALIATGRLPRRRAPAERPPPRRVGGGQPEHGARRSTPASKQDGPRGQPPGPRHLRRRGRRAPRPSWRRSPPRRSASARATPGSALRELADRRPRLREHPRGGSATPAPPPPARAASPSRTRPGRQRSDRACARSCAARSAARGRARLLRPRLPLDMPTAPRVTTAHVRRVEELEQTRDTLSPSSPRRAAAAERRAREEGRVRAQRRGGAARAGTQASRRRPLGRAMGWWRSKP